MSTSVNRIVIGVDIGKVTLSIAVGKIMRSGGCKVIRASNERHFGKPLALFRKRYGRFNRSEILGIAATGIYSDQLKGPVLAGIPEEIAREYAINLMFPENGPINIFRIGGRGYSILTRDGEGHFRHAENDKCSAGTGESIERICRRMGLSLTEAMAAAGKATGSIPISARCSVFAKTEMTHFANQGEPHEQLLAGYFESVARNLHSLYEKRKVQGPVILVGNGALITPISEALQAMSADPVEVATHAGEFDALGALNYAARQDWDESCRWPADPARLIRVKQNRIEHLPFDAEQSGSVVQLTEKEAAPVPGAPACLGIDLGSTGAKAALVEAGTGVVISDVYRKTDGNPVEAAKTLVAEIIEKTDNPVVTIGLTGSGRDAAATVFRAAYPELSDRIFVQNEIVAHGTAAIKADPDKGKSLSIVEIGGQDAKFINIQDGLILESDMNRACSAGTGSFLEEQAVFYGHDDIATFGKIAASSENIPDLGQMCTVFVAELAAEALNEGYTVADIFAGFQYSVIMNYKNRVMGNRQFMERIFFQGKPATNLSLAWTLAYVTGREVYVPPNPGAMGAIGIALLAAEAIHDMAADAFFDLTVILDARITGRKFFRCKDAQCRNLCRIETAVVQVGAAERRIVSGGSCPKYEAVSAGWQKLPKDAPTPYQERRDALEALLVEAEEKPGAPVVGIPYGHYLIDYLPFFYTLFHHLGVNVRVIFSDAETFQTGNRRCSAENTCTPVKLMHGLADAGMDWLVMPKFVDLPALVKNSGTSTCPLSQAAPEIIEHALIAEGVPANILRPILHLGKKGLSSSQAFAEMRKRWQGVVQTMNNVRFDRFSFGRAYRQALQRQQRFEQELLAIGRRAIDFAHQHGYPVVLVTGNAHVIHEPIMNANIDELITRNGAVAVPLDCFPIPESIPPLPRVYWSVSNRVLRASLAAAREGGIFPLMMISYGCGPSSFVEQFFNDLLEHYPHTVLESDGHGGQAGFVTRIQAFLYSARNYTRGDKEAIPAHKIDRYNSYPYMGPGELRDWKIVPFAQGHNLSKHGACVLRASGYQGDATALTGPEGFRMARQSCSGKECLPHQLIWGSFCQYLADHPPADDEKIAFLNITGCGPCRNGMFILGNEIALEKMGLADRVKVISTGWANRRPELIGGKWLSFVSTDLLNLMWGHYRAIEATRGESDRLFHEYSRRIGEVLERPYKSNRWQRLLEKSGYHDTPFFLAGLNYYGKVRQIEKLLTRAAREFRDLPINEWLARKARTVFVTGDVYLKIDEWGSDYLVRKLSDHGLHVIIEPFGYIFQAIAAYRSKELIELETRWLKNRLLRLAMIFGIHRFVNAVRKILPDIQWDNFRDGERASRELLDGVPFTEGTVTIAGALNAWQNKSVDGVVVVGPWGCGPALIAEAQLRRKTEIPMLFIHNDGDLIDETRLKAFAWRLQNNSARDAAAISRSESAPAEPVAGPPLKFPVVSMVQKSDAAPVPAGHNRIEDRISEPSSDEEAAETAEAFFYYWDEETKVN